jgi:hypothetical protein
MLSVKFEFLGRVRGSPRAAERFRFVPAIEAETKELALLKLKETYEVLSVDYEQVYVVPTPMTAGECNKEIAEAVATLPVSFGPVISWVLYEFCDRESFEFKATTANRFVDLLKTAIAEMGQKK